jgi:hypothetical protein
MLDDRQDAAGVMEAGLMNFLKKLQTAWSARRTDEDDGHELFFNGADVAVLRKSDGKVLMVPRSEESAKLLRDVADRKRNHIGHAIAGFVSDQRWLTPKQAGLEPRRRTRAEDAVWFAA